MKLFSKIKLCIINIPENFLIQYFKNKLSTYQEESNQILSNQQFVQNQNPKIYKTIDS